MFHVVLYEPEIPPNTGNVIRLCANTGCHLHLIGRLGFSMDDKQLKRAGLDYREWADVAIHQHITAFIDAVKPNRLFTVSTKNPTLYSGVIFQSGDAFVFGPETRGLPIEIRQSVAEPQQLRLPMTPQNRSLNLANAVAVVVYEAWRQLNFAGAE